MVIFPAAIFLFVIWLATSLRDADRAVTVVIATLPFGMFAFLDAGGLSLLVSHCLASLTVALFCLRRFGRATDPVLLPNQALYILAFALYAIVSATVIVRLFEGRIMVFPMSVETDGLRISTAFYSSLKPLTLSSSNIAQAGYVALSAFVFVVVFDTARRRGTELIERGLVWAASLNIFLGILDMLGADHFLALVRTADYSLAHQQTVFGLPRVIGGYSEASVFGPATAVFFAYFATSYLIGGRYRDGLLALGSLFFSLVAYSTTGFAALGVACILIAFQLRSVFGRGMSFVSAHWIVISAGSFFLVLCISAMTTPLLQTVSGIIDEQFIKKQTSISGLERAAWARAGFRAFQETWGLGAGVGSIRANGFASVLLGSVGIPGTVLILLFAWSVFFSGGATATSDQRRVLVSSRVAGLTFVTGKFVSGTTPDPELMLMTLSALTTAAMVPARGRNAPALHQPAH